MVPNAHIGAAEEVNKLMEKTRMNKAKNKRELGEDNAEAFLMAFDKAFDITTPAVVDGKRHQTAKRFQSFLSGELRAAGLTIIPLTFFKQYVLTHTQQLREEGKIRSEMQNLNFYATPIGKAAIKFAITQTKAASSLEIDVIKTRQRNEALLERELPSEDQKSRISNLMADVKPLAPGEAKKLRQQRRTS